MGTQKSTAALEGTYKLQKSNNQVHIPVVHELLLEIPVHVLQVGYADGGRVGVRRALHLHLLK
jgi:hypothetical protein